MVKNFYVCSYGGCGSTMLMNALKKFGKTKHIHSRHPPDHLEYVGTEKGGRPESEWWFNGVKIPPQEIDDYYVIYIYKNPVKSIQSRFYCPGHLKNIQTNTNLKIRDVVEQRKDLYGIKEFYHNYTTPNKNRNYKIYAVKYEDIFDKQDELSKVLGIGKLNLVKKEYKRNPDAKTLEALQDIYKDILSEMKTKEFITII
jgi:hypothetical protein